MTFLPVVERELRVAARRRSTYWTRFFTALATLAASAWVWQSLTGGQLPHARGAVIFHFISGLAFTYALLAGIGITSDTISQEKREGTLGLLFLTQLAGYDVVLGKLAASSLNAFYRVFSVFPILAIPLLLGALTLSEFWRTALVITNTLFFSLSAGMLISAVSVQERRAMAGTFLLILVVTAGPAVIGALHAFQHKSAYNPTWLLTSAVYPVVLALDAAYKKNPGLFWSCVGATQALALGFLALASVLARRAWQDRASTAARSRWAARQQDWRYGAGLLRQQRRQRLLDTNPILWLNGRNRLKRIHVLAALGGLALLWLWLAWDYPRAMFDPSVYLVTAYLAHLLLKLWVASESTRLLGEDRRTGALELVLSTPLSVDQVLEGNMLALEQQFTWPVTIVLCADAAMLVGGSVDQFLYGSTGWVLMSLGMLIVFIADLYALSWVGLWLGLTSRSANRAFRGAISRVLVLPWIVFIVGLSLVATARWQTFEPSENGLLIAAFLISTAADVFFFFWARNNLRQHFRLAAAHQFTPRDLAEAAHPSPDTAQPILAQAEP